MKHFGKILTLGAALFASVSIASATPIMGSVTLSGSGDTFNATSFTAPSGSPNAVVTAATGTFLNYVPAGCCTYVPLNLGSAQINSFSFASNNAIIFYVGTNATNYITFTMNAPATSTAYSPGASETIIGTGIFTDTANDTPTVGKFSLTTTSTGITSFTLDSTVAATPEPSSLIMLGTGLVSAAGMLIRRRRIV